MNKGEVENWSWEYAVQILQKIQEATVSYGKWFNIEKLFTAASFLTQP